MHVGHLLPLMVLYWMYVQGFHACSLVCHLLYIITGNVFDNYSLEAPPHRLEILSGEQRLGKYSTAPYDREICLKSICN